MAPLVYQRVIAEGLVPPECLHEPPRIDRAALERVHTPHYVDLVMGGTLSAAELRHLGLPWSPELIERAQRVVGGTLAAARAALSHGVAMNLGGGTHHAFADRGEGYCVFNDVAVATRALQTSAEIDRVAVVDLDVHQGDGTNAIFARDPTVFTLSLHGRHNYPLRRVPGSIDVELDDATSDEAYLGHLADPLDRILAMGSPDLVFFIAGADPHQGDRLGRLALTFDGLQRRDTMVLAACRARRIPVCIVTGGGYGARVGDTVEVRLNTIRVAATFAHQARFLPHDLNARAELQSAQPGLTRIG
jgi:acetoin utilization deacetylase AcuC-like enzyme